MWRGKRAGGKRLVGLRSIGIGGHINPTDKFLPSLSPTTAKAYCDAVDREVAEEVRCGNRATSRRIVRPP